MPVLLGFTHLFNTGLKAQKDVNIQTELTILAQRRPHGKLEHELDAARLGGTTEEKLFKILKQTVAASVNDYTPDPLM